MGQRRWIGTSNSNGDANVQDPGAVVSDVAHDAIAVREPTARDQRLDATRRREIRIEEKAVHQRTVPAPQRGRELGGVPGHAPIAMTRALRRLHVEQHRTGRDGPGRAGGHGRERSSYNSSCICSTNAPSASSRWPSTATASASASNRSVSSRVSSSSARATSSWRT